jgi:hypothetical protein
VQAVLIDRHLVVIERYVDAVFHPPVGPSGGADGSASPP